MKNIIPLFILIFTVLFMSACSQQGNEYLGIWHYEKVIPSFMPGQLPDTIIKKELEIVRNGESFIISKGRETIPAVLNASGVLETHGGLISYSYVAETDKLTDGSYIFDRQE